MSWQTKLKMPKTISEEKKAVARAMLKAGSQYREIGYALDISLGSVYNIAKMLNTDIDPLVIEINKELKNKYLFLADALLTSINGYDITGSKLKDRVIAAAILTDKARALSLDETQAQKPEPDKPQEPTDE